MELNLKYVSEYLKNVEFMNKGVTIFIEAQTGTGKTTAILGGNGIEGLIDRIGDKKLIYLVNRLELKREIKLHLCDKFGITEHLNADGTVKKLMIEIRSYKLLAIKITIYLSKY